MLEFDATDADLVLFLEDTAEQLATLSDGLLKIERGIIDDGLIQAVFRAAHTLKGSSATIGHTRMARLTHAMESVLDEVRHGRMQPGVTTIDTLLAALDALQLLNEEVMTRVPNDVDVDELITLLETVVAGPVQTVDATFPALTAADQPALAAALAAGGLAYQVEVAVDPASEWPAVRSYQALMVVQDFGAVVRSWPSEAELQDGIGGHVFRLVLVTSSDVSEIEQAAGAVSEVVAVSVTPHPVTAPEPVPALRPAITTEAVTAEQPAVNEPAAATRGSAQRAPMVVKVDITRLDEMMNLVGELVIDRGRLTQVQRDLATTFGVHPALENLAEIARHLVRVSDDLQSQVLLSRLLPVENVFNRFPRMIRDLARRNGKSINFVMEGEQTGLDRSVIDEISDPLVHLLRNAVDHGVETPEDRVAAGKPAEATLRLSARHEESDIVLEVQDDGRGIDPAKMREVAVRKGLMSREAAMHLDDEAAVNLIFRPGFSSVDKVTDVSGRGVGMDIVRTNIEKVGGSVDVRTVAGAGTTFTIRLPLTLAIVRALLVRVGEAVFTVPLTSVQETLRIRSSSIQTVQRREVILIRDQTLPLIWLADLFRGRRAVQQERGEWCYVVAVKSGRQELGLVVDSLVGEQEVVIKSIGGVLGDVDGIAGATILGDGRVSMIVDVPTVVERLAPAHRGHEVTA